MSLRLDAVCRTPSKELTMMLHAKEHLLPRRRHITIGVYIDNLYRGWINHKCEVARHTTEYCHFLNNITCKR